MGLKVYLGLEELGSDKKAKQALEEAMVEAWNEISEDLIKRLLKSMLNRVKPVIKTKGWHTKY